MIEKSRKTSNLKPNSWHTNKDKYLTLAFEAWNEDQWKPCFLKFGPNMTQVLWFYSIYSESQITRTWAWNLLHYQWLPSPLSTVTGKSVRPRCWKLHYLGSPSTIPTCSTLFCGCSWQGDSATGVKNFAQWFKFNWWKLWDERRL